MLPIILNGTKSKIISTHIVQSHLWTYAKMQCLRQSMWLVDDAFFARYLLCIRDGNEDTKQNNLVQVPQKMVITWEGEESIQHR